MSGRWHGTESGGRSVPCPAGSRQPAFPIPVSPVLAIPHDGGYTLFVMPDAPIVRTSPRSLQARWAAERAELLADPAAVFKFAKQCNSEGESLLALEITETAIARAAPNEAPRPLLQQKALALSRLGS